VHGLGAIVQVGGDQHLIKQVVGLLQALLEALGKAGDGLGSEGLAGLVPLPAGAEVVHLLVLSPVVWVAPPRLVLEGRLGDPVVGGHDVDAVVALERRGVEGLGGWGVGDP